MKDKIIKLVAQCRRFLSQFVRVKKVKQLPKVKLSIQKKANALVYGGLGLLVLIGLLGSIRAMSLSGQVSQLTQQVKSLNQSVVDLPSKQVGMDTAKVERYMFQFVSTYINYNSDTASERQAELEKYFSFDLSGYQDDVKSNRTLIGRDLIALEDKGSYKLAKIRLSYETGEGEEKPKTIAVLAVPFQMSDGLLAVVSPPYWVEEDSLLGQANGFEQIKRENVELLDEKTTSSIKKFLPVFFDKYALSDKTDLKLMMKNPVLMGGNYQVKNIEDGSAIFYQKKDKIMVQVAVDFEEKSTGAVHTEHFTLALVKQSSGWFVEEFYNFYKN